MSIESLEIEVLTRKDVAKYCKELLNSARKARDAEFCIDAAGSCEKESRKTKDSFVKGELEKCRKKLVQWSASLTGVGNVRSNS